VLIFYTLARERQECHHVGSFGYLEINCGHPIKIEVYSKHGIKMVYFLHIGPAIYPAPVATFRQ
jgi:hypothetical protein